MRVRALQSDMRAVLDLPTLRVEPWRGGTDFHADLAHDGDRLLGVVRSPRVEHAPTSYDGVVDFGEVLAKEAIATELLAGAGVPVPRVLRLRRGGPVSWSLAELIESDVPVVPVPTELGRLTRTIHDIRPDTAFLRPQRSWSEFFTARLGKRLAAAARYMDVRVTFLDRVLAALRERDHVADRLLHMDLRPPNLCVRAGRVVGVLDLSNCLVGDPLLELARIRSYGLLDDAFLAGYGTPAPADELLLDIYQLDTEALLVAVSVEEVDDPALHQDKIRTTRQLCARIDEWAGSLDHE
jgi:aminoglycoside phosphotransferase (APT) family kinase protein